MRDSTERPALRHDGQPFQIRISLSSTTHEGETVFSALIDPVYECEIKVSVGVSELLKFASL